MLMEDSVYTALQRCPLFAGMERMEIVLALNAFPCRIVDYARHEIYALAGLPVVSTQENKEYRQLVDSYMCGINCRVGNAQDVADALIKLAKDPELRKQMGAMARRLGREKFDRRETYKEIVKRIENI